MDIKLVNKSNNPDPKMATKGSAGVDLAATERLILNPGSYKLINTKLSMAIPEGYVGLICSRSGLACKRGIFVLNAPGIIDSDYRGEIGVILANFGSETLVIEPGDRIAQMVFVKYESISFLQVDSLDETERGDGGYGHSGI